MSRYDVAVIGGGIVGLATAAALRHRFPRASLLLLEKEPAPARHQTGNNSGVVHSGIYYRPGSLKARLCTEGVARLESFCREHELPYDECGKIILASDESELPRLEELYRRGDANGVPDLELLDASAIGRFEPHARGVAAIHSPRTAIVDYARVAHALAARLVAGGADLRTSARLTAIEPQGGQWLLRTAGGDFHAGYLVNCAGLQADHVARLDGIVPAVRIVPFRGEYYLLTPQARHLVNGLIYPVPDPAFPFLGVHFTKTVHGEVEAGPNAVLAFAREGYAFARVAPGELAETLSYPGFWRLAARHWRMGLYEVVRSLRKKVFVDALRKLVPAVGMEDLRRAGAGVRAQAVRRDGVLVDDFVIHRSDHATHVLNAPSPAATASLSIGSHIAERVPL